MIKTFKEIKEIDNVIGIIFKRNKELENSKFGYACKRFAEKNYVLVSRELGDKIQDIRILNALENPTTKEIIKDPSDMMRGFKYSKEGLINCIKQERDIISEFEKKEIEIEPYICTSIPESITESEQEELRGLII
jgi:hypothetical protein